MRSSSRNIALLSLPTILFGLLFGNQAAAQTLTALHTFSPRAYNSQNIYTNRDGTSAAGLVLSSNTLYGAAFYGTPSGSGSIYAVSTNGLAFTNLHNFPALNYNALFIQTNSDGANPNALIFSSNVLYGTTAYGSTNGSGTVFRMSLDGTGFTNIHIFSSLSSPVLGTNSDGANPQTVLLLVSNTLYGTTLVGGSTANGTVFKLNTDGTAFTNLHTFAAGIGSFPNVTNSEGANPAAELILSNNTLYGTCFYGGTNGRGTVFGINTDGTAFTNLHTFEGGTGVNYTVTNKNGAHPSGRLCLAGNTLYGRAQFGGNSSYGTIYALNTDGTGFTNLHTFAAGTGLWPNITNSEGANPNFLMLSNNMIYGACANGGSFTNGTLFAVYTNGVGFTNLFTFPSAYATNGANNGGGHPAGLIFSGSAIYGAATGGGTNGAGTVFSLGFGSTTSPALAMLRSGTNVILTWPASLNYTLQSTTNLPPNSGWTNVFPLPTVVNGYNTVTNPISGKHKFYRLTP